jgi:hypothetical protein
VSWQWLVPVLVAGVLLGMWVAMTMSRLDRLHARVDAAGAALDAQLVRRAAALQHAAETSGGSLDARVRGECQEVAERALDTTAALLDRGRVENEVGRALAGLAEHSDQLRPDVVAELREAATRVQVARRFYNDAVRDTRAVRGRRMPRLLRLSGHRGLPGFFDIDDTILAADVKRHDQ